MKLEAVYLPDREPDTLWDVTISNNTITSIAPSTSSTATKSHSPLLLPSLCHPHIHLDKPYLLTSSASPSSSTQGETPDYSDLVPKTGDFGEALTLTSAAKSRYTGADLIKRGSQLILSSIQAGVSSMRAFVEIDHMTRFKTLEAAIHLKRKFARLCHVQICVFAQDPIFSGDHGEENRHLLLSVLEGPDWKGSIEALGTTPYVESYLEASQNNIDFAITTAIHHNLHLDFHLDYNLDPNKEPMVWYVIDSLKRHRWNERTAAANPSTTTTSEANTGKTKTIALGHCTRLTLLSPQDLHRLAREIHTANLPITFVGLPTSDLFMMGRQSPSSATTLTAPRATLPLPTLIQSYHLEACLAVNNVGNAFTPWGSVDPLRLASLGVGLYQDGTAAAAKMLLECVSGSSRAGRAIGIERGWGEEEEEEEEEERGLIEEGMRGPWLLVRNREWDFIWVPDRGLEGGDDVKVPARQWRTVTDVVWDPPEVGRREMIRD